MNIYEKQQMVLHDLLDIVRSMNNDEKGVQIVGIGTIPNYTLASFIQLLRLDVLVKAETMTSSEIRDLQTKLESHLCKNEIEPCLDCIILRCLCGTLSSVSIEKGN